MDKLMNLLWTAFGIIGGLHYYNREEYAFSVILFLLGAAYGYRVVQSLLGSGKKE